MYKSILMALVLSFSCSMAYSATVEVSWPANAPEEEITGYRLYMGCGTEECRVAEILGAATTTYTYTFDDMKTDHIFSLTAYRTEADGTITESDQSMYAPYEYKKKPVSKPGSLGLIVK